MKKVSVNKRYGIALLFAALGIISLTLTKKINENQTALKVQDIAAMKKARDIMCRHMVENGTFDLNNPLCRGLGGGAPSAEFLAYIVEEASEGCQEELHDEKYGGEKAGIECYSAIKPNQDALNVISRKHIRIIDAANKTLDYLP